MKDRSREVVFKDRVLACFLMCLAWWHAETRFRLWRLIRYGEWFE